jgi:hypothetical protein
MILLPALGLILYVMDGKEKEANRHFDTHMVHGSNGVLVDTSFAIPIYAINTLRYSLAELLLFYNSQGALTSWVISVQASLRDWSLDKGATFNENLVLLDKNITKDFINVRYRQSIFMNLSIQNVVSA